MQETRIRVTFKNNFQLVIFRESNMKIIKVDKLNTINPHLKMPMRKVSFTPLVTVKVIF